MTNQSIPSENLREWATDIESVLSRIDGHDDGATDLLYGVLSRIIQASQFAPIATDDVQAFAFRAAKDEYLVQWSIEVVADGPDEAATIAKDIQLDPESMANHFDVFDHHGIIERVYVHNLDSIGGL